jgi:hypothetical protein
MAAIDGMYVDFCIPLALYNLIQQVIGNCQNQPNTPQVVQPPALRMWFSQPRTPSSTAQSKPLTDVLTVNFKLPLSVSEIGFDALRVSCYVELWYLDRLNNWRQVLDESRVPVTLNLSISQAQAWYTAHFYCYPFVAKALQWRFTRTYDPLVGNQPYVVGMRNGLIRRNIYTRSDGTQGIEPAQDPIGNTFTSYIKDWDAAKAIDNAPITYWRSMPMPDPAAVVSLYLDVRHNDGTPSLMDTLYIDPVYTGQALNLYYSNDDSVGTRKLSPVTAVSTLDENTQWEQGKGRWDTSADTGTSDYEFGMVWGPLVSQDTWIGIEWAPDFGAGFSDAEQVVEITGAPTGGHFTLSFGGETSADIPFDSTASGLQTILTAMPAIGIGNVVVNGLAGGPWTLTFTNNLGGQALTELTPNAAGLTPSGTTVTVTTTVAGGEAGGPPQNPVLFEVIPTTSTVGLYYPKIFYDVGAAEICLELTDGTTTLPLFTCPLSPLPQQYVPLRIMVGWGYSPSTVFIEVTIPNGTVLGTLTSPSPALPTQMTLDGTIGFHDFRGLFTAHVVKLENWAPALPSFMANPKVYVSPDPVMPDAYGNVPSTSLDNAIYAAAWTMQEHGTGGSHASNFSEKTWTPIWRDYMTQKGKLYFPQQISAKYLQLEFSGLTEEPYPVYDAGIQTSYQIYPVSVSQDITVAGPKKTGVPGLLSLGADVLLSGLGSVNWLNPQTVNNAINSIYGQTVTPMTVTAGPGYNTTTLPNTVNTSLTAQTRTEVSSPWIFRRSPLSPSILAAQTISVATSAPVVQAGSSSLAASSMVPVTNGSNPADSFTPLLAKALVPSTLPRMGSDWWVFPGGNLRLPATVMNGLTALTDVITHRKSVTETRLRFSTTCVHRYDVKTVTRDAAVAYFAGLREVQPFSTYYVDYQDPDVFTFSRYNDTQGWHPNNITALESGPITTASREYKLVNHNFDTDINNWRPDDGRWAWDGDLGHWYLGTAAAAPDGGPQVLVSNPMDASPGAHLDASVWVSWAGLAATANSPAIQLQALYFYKAADNLNYEDTNPWPASTPPDTVGNVWEQISANTADGNGFTVPAGANYVRLALVVTSDATAGTVWFDTVEINTPDQTWGKVFRSFKTTSSFAKLTCTFTDTGLVRSDDMWARQDPNDTNISNTALAYYTTLIPDLLPAGMWSDTFAEWADPRIVWGTPRAVVAISVDPDRTFQGKRVLHFSRVGGAAEAGVKVRQQTNFVANGLFRIGCIFYKPYPNNNQIILRLRRISDGVYIHQETFTPVVGYWYEYVTHFIEIPDSEDQEYTVEFVCTGDDPDEVFLNDLWCDVAQIRYYVCLGTVGVDFLHDVTPLRYAGLAVVSCTEPVSEFSVQAVILSPHSYCYGGTFAPNYLK